MKCLFFAIALLIVNFSLAQQNVGIGTNIPSAKLHINGSLKITNGSQGEGKVLTSDAAGLATWKVPEKSIFKATGFEQTFDVAPNTSRKLIDWKTVELNVGANSIFVNAQGDLFVLKEGYYRVTAKVTVRFSNPGDSQGINLSILVNGTRRLISKFPVSTNGNSDIGISVTSIFQLKAQDKISFEFDNNMSNTSARFFSLFIDNKYAEFSVEQL